MTDTEFVALCERIINLALNGDPEPTDEQIQDQIILLGVDGHNPYYVAANFILLAKAIPLAINSAYFKDSVVTLDTSKVPANLQTTLVYLKERGDEWKEANDSETTWFGYADGDGSLYDRIVSSVTNEDV